MIDIFPPKGEFYEILLLIKQPLITYYDIYIYIYIINTALPNKVPNSFKLIK